MSGVVVFPWGGLISQTHAQDAQVAVVALCRVVQRRLFPGTWPNTIAWVPLATDGLRRGAGGGPLRIHVARHSDTLLPGIYLSLVDPRHDVLDAQAPEGAARKFYR